MVAQFGRALLASLPLPDFSTGATVVSSCCQAPHNVRSNKVPRLSSAATRVPTSSSVRHRPPLAMALGAASADFLLVAARGNLSEILVKMAPPDR